MHHQKKTRAGEGGLYVTIVYKCVICFVILRINRRRRTNERKKIENGEHLNLTLYEHFFMLSDCLQYDNNHKCIIDNLYYILYER